MRRSAEKAMRPGENAGDGPRLLPRPTSRRPATAGRGWPRPDSPRASRPKRSPRRATPGRQPTSARLTRPIVYAASARASRAADHDRRVDALLFAKKPSDAYRFLPASARRAAPRSPRGSRCRPASPDAEARYQPVMAQVTSDAGLMMDRARYLRDSGLRAGRRAAVRRGRTISPTARPTPSASTKCCCCCRRRRRRRPMAHRLRHRPPGRRHLPRRAPTSA